MALKYRLAGSQDPSSRIDRWVVETASPDHPDGVVLELNGPAVELTDEQYTIGSRFMRLVPVDKNDELQEGPVTDQTGLPSLSTDQPPDPGTAPDVDSLNKEQLVAELGRVRAREPRALPEVSEKSNKEDLAKALRSFHGLEV
jgi:hypothetical protein